MKARVEPGLKEDGGHMVRTVVLGPSLSTLRREKPKMVPLGWIRSQHQMILPLNGAVKKASFS